MCIDVKGGMVHEIFWMFIKNKKTVQEAIEILELTKEKVLDCQVIHETGIRNEWSK